MRVRLCCLLLVIAALLQSTAPRVARTQGNIQDLVKNPDSLRALANKQATDSLSVVIPRWLFDPVYNNYTEATLSYYGMRNEMNMKLVMPWRSLVNFQLKDDEKNYRLQNRLEKNKLMLMGVVQPLRSDVNASFTYSDSRVFNRSISLGGGIQDLVVNDLSVAGGLNYNRTFKDMDVGSVRLDAGVSASANNGERAYKTDKTLAGGVFGGIEYKFSRVTLTGRGSYRETDERSITALTTLEGLGATEDSLVAGARVQVTDSSVISVHHMDYEGERLYADQRRGSQGGQIAGAEEVYPEREVHPARRTTVSMSSRLFGRFGFSVSAYHEFNQFAYDTTLSRNSAVTTDAFAGSADYRAPWRSTTATVTFEGGTTYNNLLPLSTASVYDYRKLVRVAISHRFKPTLTLDLNGSTQLLQSDYLNKAENPRDRDQLDSSVSARLSSVPFSNFLAFVSASYTNSLFQNISSTQSQNNRTRELYELRPGFSYFVNQYLTIAQTYGISIDYTQYKYLAASSQDDYLDRNFTFNNEFKVKPMQKVDLRFLYTLLVHDKGSYFSDVLEIDQRDNRQETILAVDYRPKDEFRFFGENTYSRRVEEGIEEGEDDAITTTGSIRVGVECNYAWGDKGRKLNVYCARVKRFNPSSTELEKNFWDARSEFSFPF